MAVFSEIELAEFKNTMDMASKDAMKGKKPSVSSVLMSLQFATTMPNEKGKFWFEDRAATMIILLSIRKIMDENTPDMFTVGEKAYMFSIVNMGKVLMAIDAAGVEISGFTVDANGNRVDDEDDNDSSPDEDGEEWKKGT
jgi:hypothetical protein